MGPRAILWRTPLRLMALPTASRQRLRPVRHWASRYALACAIVAVATLARAAVDPLIHDQVPYFIYVAAVVVAAWGCGVDGGVLAAVLSAFVGNYWFVPPRYEIVPHREDLYAMGLFTVLALGLVWLVGRWKRAERDLWRQTDELHVLKEEAERANRLKDEFLATLSHELRTPLNAILGWARMLDDRRLDEAGREKAVHTIIRNADVQARLVEDVLDVSRIISGKMRLSMAAMDLTSVVATAIEMVRPAALAKGIEITSDLSRPSAVVGDADRLQQVAWNLLSNAVKFTPKHGRVDVRVETLESQATLTVSDTGIGVEPDFLPHLFERFRQADASTTRQYGGLGLGLAIVRHMVELHGGTVRAESGGPGRGTTFIVSLPVRAVARVGATSADQSGQPAAGGFPALEGLRVLAVDDEPDARELVIAALTPFGVEVRTAESAAEAVRALSAWRPHVLLADIGMPVEDGYSLIRRIRARAPENGGLTPAAALTAYARPDDRARALAAGFQDHVAKPTTPEELARVVAALANSAGWRPSADARR